MSFSPRRLFNNDVFLLVLIFLINVIFKFSFTNPQFPLNDGGMFASIVTDLVSRHFTYISHISYNFSSIPFAYPPLAFYLGSVISHYLHLDVIQLLQLYPPFLASLLPPLFYLFCRLVSRSPKVSFVLALIFSLLPRSYVWLIAGGGLTRSTGYLFTLVALIFLFSVKNHPHKLKWGAIFFGFACLTHLDMALFLSLTLVLLFLYSRLTLRQVTILSLIVLTITSPYLLHLILNNQLSTFLSAFRSGSWSLRSVFLTLIVNPTDEFIPAIYGLVGLFGILISLRHKHTFLPLWFILSIALNPRGGGNVAIIPLTFLILTGWKSLARRTPIFILIPFLLTLPFVTLANIIVPSTRDTLLSSVSTSHRQAFLWISQNTPAQAHFLVVPNPNEGSWFSQKTTEWFPVLTQRKSVNTVQGTEWLPTPTFHCQEKLSYWLKLCHDQTSSCLEKYIGPLGDFTHLLVVVSGNELLVKSLQSNPNYSLLYSSPDTLVFWRSASKI